MLAQGLVRSSSFPLLILFLIGAVTLQGILPILSHAASAITSDGTMGTMVTQAGNLYNIDGGTIRGTNQFHSLGLFSVGRGDTASFNGPPVISNIISRVTGGQQSLINGGLKSTISGANLFLLNPAGVLFGPTASLDVSGSVHVSTADYLKLSDGGMFYANPLTSSVLTTAPPAAFGFLGNTPAPIIVQDSSLQVPSGKGISLVGGDISLTNDTSGYLWAPSGQINLVSVASPGEVSLSHFKTDSFARLGDITSQPGAGLVISVEGSNYNTDPAGTIIIRGGKLLFANHTSLRASGNPGGTVSIVGVDLHMDNDSWISTATRGSVNHPSVGADIRLTGDLILTNGSEIASSGYGAGRAGDITITASNIQLGDDDPTKSLYSSTGYYGDIGSRAFGSGRGGDVSITADRLIVQNGFFINTAALSWGNAGNITVKADTLELLDRGSISSNALWAGQGGVVDIVAKDIFISGRNAPDVANSSVLTGIAAQTGYGSKGGVLKLTADNLCLLDGGQINTLLYSIGPGANIEVNARNISISGSYVDQGIGVHSAIDARLSGPYANGIGGNIDVVSENLNIADGGFIGSFLFQNAPGNAGHIAIRTQGLHISGNELTGISASSAWGTGSSGDIDIVAKDITIVGPKGVLDPFGSDGVGITTGTTSGKGGTIRITADNLIMTDRGFIWAGSNGSGTAGAVEISTGNLEVLNGATISSVTFGSGDGGGIDIKADSVLLSGVYPERYIEHGVENMAVSNIASATILGGGSAGNVRIASGSLQLLDGARISVESFGAGQGGSAEISADHLLIAGINPALRDFLLVAGADPKGAGAAILSVSHTSSSGGDVGGNAGNISIAAGDLVMRDGGVVSSSTNTSGTGGTIEVRADRVSLSSGAFVSSESNSTNATNAGRAGDILIETSGAFQSADSSVTTASKQAKGGHIGIRANEIELTGSTVVSAESSGVGDAGNIDMMATNALLMKNSSITTEARQADGGNIDIQSGYMVQLIDSKITASVNGGPETTGGNITIDPRYVILNDSQIIANAYEGRGGNIQISAGVFLASPESVVDASSALGINGTVEIRAPIKNISEKLTPLQGDVLRAEAILRDRCAARIRGDKYSSFVVSGRDGLPIRPGSVLPSPVY